MAAALGAIMPAFVLMLLLQSPSSSKPPRRQLQETAAPEPGPPQCPDGFVWRAANTNDTVCVAPWLRDVAQQENKDASVNMGCGFWGSETCLPIFELFWSQAWDVSDHVSTNR